MRLPIPWFVFPAVFVLTVTHSQQYTTSVFLYDIIQHTYTNTHMYIIHVINVYIIDTYCRFTLFKKKIKHEPHKVETRRVIKIRKSIISIDPYIHKRVCNTRLLACSRTCNTYFREFTWNVRPVTNRAFSITYKYDYQYPYGSIRSLFYNDMC